ncbi:MAG: redoxin domain-containing protein [Bryobacteraceae bacterium]
MPPLPVAPALLLAALSFQLPDTEGVLHTSAEFRQSKAVVLVFVAGAPRSSTADAELARVFAAYAPRGVSFYAVQSDPGSTGQPGFRFPVLRDPQRQLARFAGVDSTPAAVVLSPAGEVLYRGRLDTSVAAALDRALAGRPAPPPTFTRDVAPILYQHCAVCHHRGEVAPFALLTYQDAAKRAKLIAAVTASRYMPPWQPEPGYGHFQGERRMRDADIATLRRWAEAGAPQGDPARLPPAPTFPEGWQLGAPDMTVRMPKPFAIAADGPDQYMCFVIPLRLTADKYVRALEFRPEARSVVHHALFLLDSGHIGRQLGEAYPCFGTPGFLPSGALGGWTPGMQPARMPGGLQLVLRKGSDLVMQIHYHPTGKPETDQSTLGLYFTDKPPTKWVADIALGSHQIDIPAGERAYKVRDHFTTPVDVEAVAIIPHAHYICKEMNGWAILPDGRKQWLIRIRDWNFNWQEQYRYATPVKLPADTDLQMEFTYDNSDANPRNPNHPAKRVVWGPDTTDEMAGLHVQVVPEDMDDWHELGQALWGKFMRSVGGGFYRKPND